MPSRELVYRISINTATAKREAGNIRAAFERELRQIKVGALDTSSLKTATDQARQLRQELENVKPPNVGNGGAGGFLGKGIDDTVGQLKSLALGYVGVQGAIAAIGKAVDLAELDTQARRANKSFEILSKGADMAKVNIYAIQTAAGGATTSLEAINVGAQAASLGLAKTSAGFAELARASRIVTQVSPIIKDQGEALTQLALFASNAASYARADQLGLAAGEVRDRIEELRKTYGDLDDSQLKLMASTQLLEQKFGALLNSTESQATGLEKLRAAYGELQVAVAGAGTAGFVQNAAGDIASAFNQLTVRIQGTDAPLAVLIENLRRAAMEANAIQDADPLNGLLPNSIMGFEIVSDPGNIDKVRKALEEATKGVQDGIPGANDYLAKVTEIAVAVDNANAATADQVTEVRRLQAAYQSMLQYGTAAAAQQAAAAKARADEETRQSRIYDQQGSIEQALSTRAQKASQAPGVGIEAAIAEYQKQRQAAKEAIDQLVASGVSNAGEIAINVSAIIAELTAPFDELEARASQGFTIDVSALDSVGAALSNISAGFVDFLPGIESARTELISLSDELAITGQLSDEQAARLEYLSTVAYAVADGSSQLGLVVGELGGAFLESNSYAAELVTQLYLAEAAYRSNQIGAGEYAGMTTVLSGRLLTLAQAAGIATGELYALNQAQADMSNLSGFGAGQQVGGSIAQRIQTQQAASGREQNRREMERYNTAVARQQETSAKRAGKALEDGAKKASDTLKNALDKVPGLFSTTDVTEKDMKDAGMGIYADKADEKLRRLRDEVENDKDWADVSIEDAKASIEKLGIKAANTKEGILSQFEDLWNSQALWADMSNIEQWIDKGAVEQQMVLQQKSEEGRNNIYKFFGVQIDEATSAATGGGGAAPAPVAPPKLVDIDPYTDGMQTGLDEYVDKNGQLIQEQIANAPGLMVDLDKLFAPGAGLNVATTGAMSVAAPAAQLQSASMSALSSQKQGTAASQALAITPTLPADAAEKLALEFGDQLSKQAAVFVSHGTSIGGNLLSGLSAAISVNAKGETQVDVAGFIAGNLAAQAQTFIAQGTGIATLIGQGIDEGLAGAGSTATIAPTIHPAFVVDEVEKQNIISAVGAIVPTVNVALALSAEAGTLTTLTQSINTSIRTIQPDIKREGATAAQMLAAGITTALGSTDTPIDVATPLITALTTNLGANAALFATPGTMVAQLIMAAILANMQGGQQAEGGEGGGPIASALVTNLMTQFATAAPMFTAAGIVPAQIVEAGFKGHVYTGMADNLQASINQAIGAKAAEFIQTGSYIGGWIQQGINSAFTTEVNLSFAVNAGASWGTAFMKGALTAVGGGTLVQAISDKVVTDIANEMEQP